jgi:RNA recognition motif-containing protein
MLLPNVGFSLYIFLSPRYSHVDCVCIYLQIRETPNKKHHKFIEFYDVRASEAALRSLNKSEIAGKRIKLEPSRPGGTRKK